jgi:multidrug efflux pump subunit AcrB
VLLVFHQCIDFISNRSCNRLVVDDGIVVTENIFKKSRRGMSPIEAAIKGSNEIFFAVISISITLAAVFLPVIFLEGFVGRLFRNLASS